MALLMDVEMTGFVTGKAQVRTVKDLRDLVKWCDKYQVRGESEIDWGSGCVYLDLHGSASVAPATWIECGDHLVDDIHFDILVETHSHPEHKTPAKYDWPSIDRYGDPSRPE